MDGLELLLNAPSKEFVNEAFQTAFGARSTPVSQVILEKTGEAMELDSPAQAAQMYKAIGALIDAVLFESVGTKEGVLRAMPAGLNSKLKNLVVGVIAQNLPQWRAASVSGQLSAPKLKDFDWRIDIKAASDTINRISLPTALVQMKVEDNPTSLDDMSRVRNVTFEMTKETLDTMLDGLGKIKDQLSSVAGAEGSTPAATE